MKQDEKGMKQLKKDVAKLSPTKEPVKKYDRKELMEAYKHMRKYGGV